MDVVGGFPLADGTCAKALTGIDDHSRMCVSARLMARERTRAVCDGLRAAIPAYGVPQQILTDNGKVFTGRFHHPPVEVLFDRICRENGIEHLLTQPRARRRPARSNGSTAACVPNSSATQRLSLVRRPPSRPSTNGWLLQHRPAAPIAGHGHPGRTVLRPAHAGRSPRSDNRPPNVPGRSGSAAGWRPTVWSVWPGSKSGSASTTPGPAAMSMSTVTCCGSGSATSWSRPPRAPAAAR